MIRLMIGVPAYRSIVRVELASMFAQLTVMAQDHGDFPSLMFGFHDVCSVDAARNRLVVDAIRAEADWLLMFDADCWCVNPQSILTMIADAQAMGPDLCVIVGAATPHRAQQGRAVMVRCGEKGNALMASLNGEHRLFRVEKIGTGCMAVRVEAAWELSSSGPWFQSVQRAGGEWSSEDFNFCDRLKQDTGRRGILCDPRVFMEHAK